MDDWLAASFRRHRGNADVVRQELQRVHGLHVSLRTVERAVRPWRQALEAEARATVRFETPPGRQLQIDFGTTAVRIGGEPVVVRLFVATLGYSRRAFVAAFDHERQSAWLDGLEGAFHHFGGVPEEVLVDNARALVDAHDWITRVVVFDTCFLAFARYWGFQPRACAPCRARTKGKDKRGVGYVKRNAIAGRTFDSWAALEAHLSQWLRTVATCGFTGPPASRRWSGCSGRSTRPTWPESWVRRPTGARRATLHQPLTGHRPRSCCVPWPNTRRSRGVAGESRCRPPAHLARPLATHGAARSVGLLAG